ncbi:MAG: carboxymuconolactone decarboxylase family protein, partial [Candidatus Sumerlaeia bacterium]|nr:carboxymuconolactone decarboxylase family protein [Candidatus Sumerlaeia bacterium]
TEKGQRALDRLRETFGAQDLPAGVQALAGSESGINDLSMNLKRQFEAGKLEAGDKLLVATAVASAAGSAEATRVLASAAAQAGVAPQRLLDAIAAAAVCTAYNGYYRFRHLAGGSDFEAFRAGFHASTFINSTLTAIQVELINVVVSSHNGCPDCVQSHLKKAREQGLSNEQLDEAVKAGAIAAALAAVTSALAGAAK